MFFKIKIILILFLWKTKYCQNLCGFQVGVAADGKSRGAKKGEEKENLGHGHSPDAHHHLSHAPWQGRPGAQQGSFLGDQGREEEERRQMGFASRIRPSLLTAWHLVGGCELSFQQSRRYDGGAILSGWERLVAGGRHQWKTGGRQRRSKHSPPRTRHPRPPDVLQPSKCPHCICFHQKCPLGHPETELPTTSIALQHLVVVWTTFPASNHGFAVETFC